MEWITESTRFPCGRRNTSLYLILFGPKHLRVQASLLPCFLPQATDHIPRFAPAIFEWSLRRNTIFTAHHAPVWSRKRKDAVDECP